VAANTYTQRLRARWGAAGMTARDDSGIAMATVVASGAILFVLTTMLITLAVFNSSQTHRQEARVKALHMADAGLNAYLYHLRRDGHDYALTNPTIGWTNLDDGRWSVQATTFTTSTDVQIRAVGAIPGEPATRTVVANVRFPTYAEYMFLRDDYINIGANAVIGGKVRSNTWIKNLGQVLGLIEVYGSAAGGTLSPLPMGPPNAQGTGGPAAHPGWVDNMEKVDFNKISAKMDVMKTLATSAGTYFAAVTGNAGYLITFSGTQASIKQIRTVNSSTGAFTFIGTEVIKAIPGNGQFYFDQDVWVRGDYNAQAMVAGSRDIYIPENLQPTGGLTNRATLGVVAQRDIIVPSWYSSMPQNVIITAAMLANTGSIHADIRTGTFRTSATITGSMSDRLNGGFVQVDASGNQVGGFSSRVYNYDNRLKYNTPPNYPTLDTGMLNVDSWIEQ
jgi:hypothetical protein